MWVMWVQIGHWCLKWAGILKEHHHVIPSRGSHCSKPGYNMWFINQSRTCFHPLPPTHFGASCISIFLFPIQLCKACLSSLVDQKKVCSHWLSPIIIVSISGVERVSVVWVFGGSWCFNCTHTLWSLQASQYPTTRLIWRDSKGMRFEWKGIKPLKHRGISFKY